MNDYDSVYGDTEDYFGSPNSLLLDHMEQIRPGGRVLDIGVGQGRNALSLARAGYRVVGIDTSAEAIAQTRAAARAENLEIELHQVSFMDYEPDGDLDAILVFGLIQTLSRAECASLYHRIYTWSKRDTVLMITAWHVDDPIYGDLSETWTEVGLHCFRCASGEYRTFLPKGQIRDIFLQWRVHHYREYLGPVHVHGDSPEHQHGDIEFIASRR